MKHAYLIMAHTDFNLLKILLSLLDDSRNDLYLHIDKKANFSLEELKLSQAGFYLLEPRLNVGWGDVSQIELELLLFETAYKNGPYAYYHLLSGVDLPIKSQDYIHRFFEENAGKEFVGFWHERDGQAFERVCFYHLFMRYERGYNRYLQIIISKLRNLIRRLLYIVLGERKLSVHTKEGPNWVSITHDFCGYLLQYKKWIKRRFKYTMCADEVFLQSVLWASPYRNRLYNAYDTDEGCMRQVDWMRGSDSSPYVWRIADWEILKASDKLFARKFDSVIDGQIIEKVKHYCSVVN